MVSVSDQSEDNSDDDTSGKIAVISTINRWLSLKDSWEECLRDVRAEANGVERQSVAEYDALYNKITGLLEPLLLAEDTPPSCEHPLCMARADLLSSTAELNTAIEAYKNATRQLEAAQSASGTSTDAALHRTILDLLIGRVSDKIAIVTKEVTIVAEKHASTKIILSGLAKAANETNVTCGTAREEDLSSKLPATATENDISPSRLDTLLEGPSADLVILPNYTIIPEDTRTRIQKFSKFLNTMVRASVITKPDEEEYTKNIAVTVKRVLEWERGQDAIPTPCYLPNGSALEICGVQPILYAILRTLAKIVGQRDHVVCEVTLAKSGRSSKRRIDFVLSEEEESSRLPIVPALLGLVAEVKPVSRKGVSFEKLTQQGANQVLGHLAKILRDSFELGGIGVDRKVSGLVLTLVSVEVIELELFGMGSSEICVTKRSSGLQPLFHLDTASRANLCDNTDLSAFSYICSDEEAPAEGFQWLCRLLACPDEKPPSFTAKVASCCFGDRELNLGERLGSGAFSVVYKPAEGAGTFIKIPKTPRALEHLQTEVRALMELTHDSIPKLRETRDDCLSTLKVTAHCMSSEQKCLCLKGTVGDSATEATIAPYVRGEKEGLVPLLNRIYSEILSAVLYAHEKNWAHLDIRPSNCIVHIPPDRPADAQVLLIDWGCAAKMTEKIKGFRGCFPFAHDNLLAEKQSDWKPTAEYDLASVAYTLASLSQGKLIPWNHFSQRVVPNESLVERSKVACTLLEANGLDAAAAELKKLKSYREYIERNDVNGYERKRKRDL
jgi:Protein kinase domain